MSELFMLNTAAEPPRTIHSLTEVARLCCELGTSYALKPLRRMLPKGDGHTVMTLPGFMAADSSTTHLRGFLAGLGYRAIPWGKGRNTSERGITSMQEVLDYRADTEAALAVAMAEQCDISGEKLSLIGWSLGGLFATSIAQSHPHLVRQVVTLGTPYGDPRGTAVWSIMQRLYKREVKSRDIDAWHAYNRRQASDVPVTALYSDSDGFVSAEVAMPPEAPRTETIRVLSSHVGFPFNPVVQYVVAERLAQTEGQWQPYSGRPLRPLIG